MVLRWFALALGIAALAVAGCGGEKPDGASAAGGAHPSECPTSKQQPNFNIELLLGKSLENAKRVAAKHGYTLRTVFIDGKPQAATMDYSPDRLNVVLRDDVVTQLCSIG